ncbi:UDP-N-acetylmuramoyl-tripeptide--D-alanyl-D-alanine ligase [Candidatus Peregrinibacteria bacterium]|nr:UDP-N-acetylmuramoyl-tripeptide--D-alanyl-D-alanine ligase [Candidatus Peregrinibacteria bacterium]
MKAVFRFIITGLLAFRARRHLKKGHTRIIAITGSMGKTSTKEAAYTILKKRFNVFRNPKGFNTELGMSLAILGENESGFSSAKAWLRILKRAFFNPKPFYGQAILEMGADHPGDLRKLMKIAPPSLSVITHVAPVHLGSGQFKDIADIAREKSTLIKNLPAEGVAIVNFDDLLVRAMETKARRVTYGTEEPAMLRATAISSTAKNLRFTAHFDGQSQEFTVPLLGKFQVYICLAATAIALQFGVTLKECAETLKTFSLPPGRMNPIDGISNTMVIDGSYNASPYTMARSLELLRELKAGRKIAALGTMNELGEMTKKAHLAVGKQAAEIANLLIAVGPEAAHIKQGAVDAGMPESQIFTFLDSEEAGHFLKEHIQPKDLILVKGSQNRVRMEKLVKMIMEKPEDAPKLLCRQEEAWGKI